MVWCVSVLHGLLGCGSRWVGVVAGVGYGSESGPMMALARDLLGGRGSP